ncbi:hypothetical protein B0H14DRAFT_3714720 [Mycena olivaceomarginata]|nr:hypothetical protein B0H14DRAFT_3714720 [Mycena olivaceomarginata]
MVWHGLRVVSLLNCDVFLPSRLLWVDEIRKREPRPFTTNNIIDVARRSKELTRNTSNNYWRRNDERATKAGDVLHRSIADNAIHGRNSSEKKCRIILLTFSCRTLPNATAPSSMYHLAVDAASGRFTTGGSRGFGYHERLLKANGGSDKDKSGSGAERLPSTCLGPATGRSCEERAHPKLSIAYRLIQLERASATRVLGVFGPGTLFVGRGGFPLVFVGRTMWYPEELPGPRLRESQMNAGGRHPVSERLGVI